MRVRFADTAVCFAFAAVALLAPMTAHAQANVDCDLDRKEVRSLHFAGNRTFKSGDLSARVLTTPSSFLHRHVKFLGTKRCYPSEGLASDVSNLKLFYKNYGFYDARIDTLVQPVSSDAVEVTFRINEGLPIILDTLDISGLDSVKDAAAMTRNLALKVGGRFGGLLLVADVDTITRRLRNAGYPRAAVLMNYHADTIGRHAQVHLDAITGPLSHFGAINVASTSERGGRPEIDSAVVIGLLGFRTGDQYSDKALAEAQRNLYNLGTFRHVGVTADTTPTPGDSTRVRVDLREDAIRQFDLDEGWATLDCFRVNARLTNRNFLNSAKRLELTGRLSKIGYAPPTSSRATRNLCYRPSLDQDSTFSSKLNYYAGASLRQPTLFGTHWVPSYTAFTERRGEYRAYLRTTYIGGEAAATRDIGLGMPLRVGYSLEYGRTEAEPANLCAVFSRCDVKSQAEFTKNQRLAVASISLQRIRTNDAVEPSHGYIIGGEIRGASTFIGSDSLQRFAKATLDASWYRALSSRMVVALRTRAGVILAPSDTSGARLPPPQERLYTGGNESVRGFSQNELGPLAYLVSQSQLTLDSLPDGSHFYRMNSVNEQPTRRIPIGGNTLFVFNAELRIRDPFFPNLFEYVPFLDGGQIWTRVRSGKGFDLNNIVTIPGLELRVFSPVGPIRLNAGYNDHSSVVGPAYFPKPIDELGRAPLICVTPPGVTPVPFTIDEHNQYKQGPCPLSYAPTRKPGFFQRLQYGIGFGTNF